MIVKIKCKHCDTINIINMNKKLLHREINRGEGGALLGDEMLEVEEIEVDERNCRGCGKLLDI